MSHLLLVDDDEMFVDTTGKILTKLGHTATVASSVAEARVHLEKQHFDLLMLDIILPDGSGLQVLDACGDARRAAHVALVTGHPSVKPVVKSLYGSNISYLVKPFDPGQLRSLLSKAEANDDDQDDESVAGAHYGSLVGESDVMQEIYQIIERVGATGANVLLQGESGVGKELVARAIHSCSNPASPFIAANCGAFSKELIGSELCGHVKGAFTGAVKNKTGLFERAIGGTLFLDEITEMPINQQPILLRALETKFITPVGGADEVHIHCRVISAANRNAANRNIDDVVEDHCLREDLYFRLAVFPIAVPALRERRGDIALLAKHFLHALNTENNTQLDLSEDQLARLSDYDWPDNVRGLRHAMHRAYLLSNPDSGPVKIPDKLASPFSRDSAPALSQQLLGSTINDAERKLIVLTLHHCAGNKTQTAEVPGISLKTLYDRRNKYEAVS